MSSGFRDNLYLFFVSVFLYLVATFLVCVVPLTWNL